MSFHLAYVFIVFNSQIIIALTISNKSIRRRDNSRLSILYIASLNFNIVSEQSFNLVFKELVKFRDRPSL